jgi:hypothetical protein
VPFAPSCGNLLKCWRKLRSVLAVVVLSLCAAQLTAQPAPNIDGEFAVFIDGLGNYSRPIQQSPNWLRSFSIKVSGLSTATTLPKQLPR